MNIGEDRVMLEFAPVDEGDAPTERDVQPLAEEDRTEIEPDRTEAPALTR